MKPISAEKIIQLMEGLRLGDSLAFKIQETFGVRFAIIELNPNYPQKHQSKYLLRWGKDEEGARKDRPLVASDKSRYLAAWLAERAPVLIEDALGSEDIKAA